MGLELGLLAYRGLRIDTREGGDRPQGKAKVLVGAAMAALLIGTGAQADTLADAISLAYQTNPTLKVQREQLKALDEQFVQASQNLRPQATFDAVYRNTADTLPSIGGNQGSNVTTGTAGVSASQVLSTFGRTTAQISIAQANILAGREVLRQAENDLVMQVIQAYAAVRRDEAGVDINRLAVTAFQVQVDQARERLKAGDSTLTDIAQAESQLASTQAALVQAQGQLQASRSTYARLVGQNPGTLEPIPALPNMPTAVDAAYAAAEDNSPVILQAVMNEKSGRASIVAAKAELRPTVSLTGSYAFTGAYPFDNRTNPVTGAFRGADHEAIVGMSFDMPLINGGFNRSKIRAAESNDRALVSSIEVARRQVVDTVSTSWNQIVSSEQQYTLGQTAVSTAVTSSEGAKLEYDEGFRAFFEVLNEQERLYDARLLVTQAEYNRIVGQTTVLDAIGMLDAGEIISGVPSYNSKTHFDKIHGKGGTPLDPVIATIDHLTGPGLPAAPNVTSQAAPMAATIAPATNPALSGAGFSTTVPTETDDGDVLGKLINQSKQTDRDRYGLR